MHSMLAHWVPPLERSKFAAIVYAGIIVKSLLLLLPLIDINSLLENIYIFLFRCEFRNCRFVTSEWLAMFVGIMGRLATCILFIWRTWSCMVCILVDIYIRYSFATCENRSFRESVYRSQC